MSERVYTAAEYSEFNRIAGEKAAAAKAAELTERDHNSKNLLVYTLNQAAGKLNLSTDATRRLLIETGCLDFGQKDGSRPIIRVTAEQIERLIEARTIKGPRVRKDRKPQEPHPDLFAELSHDHPEMDGSETKLTS